MSSYSIKWSLSSPKVLRWESRRVSLLPEKQSLSTLGFTPENVNIVDTILAELCFCFNTWSGWNLTSWSDWLYMIGEQTYKDTTKERAKQYLWQQLQRQLLKDLSSQYSAPASLTCNSVQQLKFSAMLTRNAFCTSLRMDWHLGPVCLDRKPVG